MRPAIFHAAILAGDLKRLDALLDENPDLSVLHNGMTVLHCAALVEGRRLNGVYVQLWFLAVGSGNREFVAFLLSLVIDIGLQRERDRATAFQVAAAKGLRDMALFPMERNPDKGPV
jgi:ankyrin repeat protein